MTNEELVERAFRLASGGRKRNSRGFSPEVCRRLKLARDTEKEWFDAALKGGSTLGVLR